MKLDLPRHRRSLDLPRRAPVRAWGLASCLVPLLTPWLALAQAPAQAQTQAPAQLAALPAPGSPEAQIPPSTLVAAVRLAIDAAKNAAPPQARVVVEPGRLDARLTLAPCARAEAYMPAGGPSWGRVRVGLRCTDGVVRWNVFLPLNVQVFAPALVLNATLAAGTRLDESVLRLVEVDWSQASGPLYEKAQPLVGRLLARALPAGQPLQAAHLQARLWFAQGDTVRILASGPGFSIVGEGQALTAGQEGKPARVQTENGRVLTGRAVSERCFEVSL